MTGSNAGRWLTGGVIILVGLTLLLNNLGVTDLAVWSLVWRLWPLLLIYWGLSGLAAAAGRGRPGPVALVLNLGLAVFGLLLLGSTVGFLPFGVGAVLRLLPALVLIGAGLVLMTSRRPGDRTHWAVLSGLEMGKAPFDLTDLSLVACMGGGKVDLTQARIAEPEVTIDCFAMMGGFDIFVPADVRIECDGIAVMGGIEVDRESMGGLISQRRIQSDGTGPLLRFRAQALMGGVKIARRPRPT